MTDGRRNARCGWARPVLPKTSGAVHCADCHGRLKFNGHINQWVHETVADR